MLWGFGLPGVVAASWLLVPRLVADQVLPVPLWMVCLLSAIQSALLVALAVLAGTLLAPRVRLRAPVISSLAGVRSSLAVVRVPLLAGLAGGIVGAVILHLSVRFSPQPALQLQAMDTVPLLVRMLYGGITEEILVRWGLMTLILWGAWRFGQGGAGSPSTVSVWFAIVCSALAFGVAHLPAATLLIGEVPTVLAAHLVGANTIFGILAGYLFWRWGLEAAILAHLLAHGLMALTG